MNLAATLALNAECPCLPLTRDDLRRGLVRSLRNPELVPTLTAALDERPNLLAETAVFLGADDWRQLSAAVRALEQRLWSIPYLAALEPTVQSLPGIRPPPGSGLMRAYDFHLTKEGPRLIEINTNAGGGFVALTLAQQLAAGQLDLDGSPCPLAAPFDADRAERTLIATFEQEWAAAAPQLRSPRPLQQIAIVDEAPEQEFLYPDMLLAVDTLRAAGYEARITALSELRGAGRDGEQLADDQGPIDLIYNRFTDFALSSSAATLLRTACIGRETVISPSPWHHRIYAHKSRLPMLAGLPWVPAAAPVQEAAAEDLWARRKSLFFKPVDGFGGKAVYDGRKLTRRAWQDLQTRAYIAQETVPPPRRRLAERADELRFDVRVFAYQGAAIFACARLYRGQTTNFRTPGGGLALVLRADC